MRKALTLAALMGTTMLATPVFAADQQMHYAKDYSWYLELRAGAPIPVDHAFVSGGVVGDYEPDTGFHGAIAIGKELSDNWRGEVSLAITRGEDGDAVVGGVTIPHTGSVNIVTLMGSILYDFDTTGSWRPFIGAGLGVAFVNFSNLTGGGFATTGDDAVVAAALHAGVSVPLSDRTDLTGRYTLGILGGGDYAVTGGAVGQVTSTSTEAEHLITIGIRFKLN